MTTCDVILKFISDTIDRNEIMTLFCRFFQYILVLRTPEVSNFADISDSAIMLIKKQQVKRVKNYRLESANFIFISRGDENC